MTSRSKSKKELEEEKKRQEEEAAAQVMCSVISDLACFRIFYFVVINVFLYKVALFTGNEQHNLDGYY